MKFKDLILSGVSSVFIICCTNQSLVKEAIRINPQLQNIYHEYTDNVRKKENLLFLVEQSRPSDYSLLSIDSLKYTIDLAHQTWQEVNWSKLYDQTVFKEYVLPMRITNEPLEYYWRKDLANKIDISPNSTVLQNAKDINRHISVNISRETWGNNQLGYTKTIAGHYGKCDDRAILVTMAMRANGIPAAYEIIPKWGNSNNGHSICSVILPNDSLVVFQNEHDSNGNSFVHKTPKVYRLAYSKQNHTPIYKRRNQECIPPLFKNYRLCDVTSKHAIGQQEVTIELDTITNSKLVYLSVFSPSKWEPIAYTAREKKQAKFYHIGDGTNDLDAIATEGDNIGNGIMYLPSYYIDNTVIPASHPIIVSNKRIKEIICDTSNIETVSLSRKYPRFDRIKMFANQMINGVFEVANKADFSDAEMVYTILDTPLSKQQHIQFNLKKRFRYVRYRKSNGVFSIAELAVFDASNKKIEGNLIAASALSKDSEIIHVTDGDPLTYYSLSKAMNVWVGVDLKKKCNINYIEFAPRNDDNAVSTGDTYELFYWNNKWKSLGVKTANSQNLTYSNVPTGSLLWLRDLTRGKEERPFTYENDTQIWW